MTLFSFWIVFSGGCFLALQGFPNFFRYLHLVVRGISSNPAETKISLLLERGFFSISLAIFDKSRLENCDLPCLPFVRVLPESWINFFTLLWSRPRFFAIFRVSMPLHSCLIKISFSSDDKLDILPIWQRKFGCSLTIVVLTLKNGCVHEQMEQLRNKLN